MKDFWIGIAEGVLCCALAIIIGVLVFDGVRLLMGY